MGGMKAASGWEGFYDTFLKDFTRPAPPVRARRGFVRAALAVIRTSHLSLKGRNDGVVVLILPLWYLAGGCEGVAHCKVDGSLVDNNLYTIQGPLNCS